MKGQRSIDHSSRIKSPNFMPFDPSSAGLTSVLTYLHSFRDDSFSIMVNRLDSKVWNRLVSLLMHLSTDVESVQWYTWLRIISSSLWTRTLNFTDTTAADSSNLGIDISLIGANLVFPITNPAFRIDKTKVGNSSVTNA